MTVHSLVERSPFGMMPSDCGALRSAGLLRVAALTEIAMRMGS